MRCSYTIGEQVISTVRENVYMATHALYRLYDDRGRLLYIGITLRMALRVEEHRKDKAWWPNVDRIEVQHFPSRSAALAAERDAIRAESPLHNIREQVPIGPIQKGPKGTRTMPFRVPPEIKARAAVRAEQDGRSLTDVVVHALEQYGAGITPPPPLRAHPNRPRKEGAQQQPTEGEPRFPPGSTARS